MTTTTTDYENLHKNATGKQKKFYYRRIPRVQKSKKTYNYAYKRDKENHDRHLAYMVEYNKRTKDRRYTLLLTRVSCPCCDVVVNRGYLNKHMKTGLCQRRGKVIKEKGVKKANN